MAFSNIISNIKAYGVFKLSYKLDSKQRGPKYKRFKLICMNFHTNMTVLISPAPLVRLREALTKDSGDSLFVCQKRQSS